MTTETTTPVTETTTPVTETTTAPAGDALPPELQYLKDAGEDITEFLPQPDKKPDSDTGQTADPTGKNPDKKPDSESEPGEVLVGEDGRIRDAKGRFVPLQSLREERQRRQAAEKEASEHRERLARLDERLKLAQQAPAKTDDGKAKAPANPFDEPDVDPTQDLMAAFQQERRRNAWLRQNHQQTTQQTQAVLTEQGIQQSYRQDIQRYAATAPDYGDAYKHLVVGRAKELIALGYTDQKELAQALANEEQEIVRQAVTDGRSPAEAIYRLAVARGYTAAQPAAHTTQPKPAEKTPAQQQVEAINAGQEAGKTLSGAGGGAPVGLTLEQFLAMDPDDIIKLRSTPQGQRQLAAIGAL